MAKRCPRGEILRSGYTIKKGKAKGRRVAPKCVPDKGLPGKTPRGKRWLPDLGPAPLGDWSKDQSVKKRHAELRKVVRKKGCLSTLRTMTAIANVTTDGTTERLLREDYKFVEGQPWCRLKKKAELLKE